MFAYPNSDQIVISLVVNCVTCKYTNKYAEGKFRFIRKFLVIG